MKQKKWFRRLRRKKWFRKIWRLRRLLLTFVLLVALVILGVSFLLRACRTEDEEMMAGTVIFTDAMIGDLNQYNNLINIDATPEAIEEQARQVMGAFRFDGRIFLDAMGVVYLQGERDIVHIDYLLTLIGSRIVAARAVGDDSYDEELERLERLESSSHLDETQLYILQLILERIDYFEVQ